MADEYNIKITTQADPKPAQDVAAAVKNVGKESKDTGSLVDELGRKGSNTKDVYEGLQQTLQGGEGAIFGVAKAWHNLSGAFAANPFGVVIAAAMVLAPILYGIAESFGMVGDSAKKAAKESEEAAKRAEAAFAEWERAAEKLNQAKLDKFRAELKAIGDDAERILELLKEINARQSRVDQAQRSREIAEVENDPNMTATEKAVRIRDINQRFTQRARDREDNEFNETFAQRKSSADATREKFAEAAQEQFNAARVLDMTRRRRSEIQAEIDKLEKSFATMSPGESKPDPSRERGTIWVPNLEYGKTERRIDDLKGQRAFFESQNAQKLQADQLRNLERANNSVKEAGEKAAAAAEAFRKIADNASAPDARGRVTDRTTNAIRKENDAETKAKSDASIRQGWSSDLASGRTRHPDWVEREVNRMFSPEPKPRPDFKTVYDPTKEGAISFQPQPRDYDALARAITPPEKNYDALAAALLGITDAVRNRALAEQERIDALTRDLEEVKNQIKNR